MLFSGKNRTIEIGGKYLEPLFLSYVRLFWSITITVVESSGAHDAAERHCSITRILLPRKNDIKL